MKPEQVKSNYERHYSHKHCWEQVYRDEDTDIEGVNILPACGQPLENHKQCCLCDLPFEPSVGKKEEIMQKVSCPVIDCNQFIENGKTHCKKHYYLITPSPAPEEGEKLCKRCKIGYAGITILNKDGLCFPCETELRKAKFDSSILNKEELRKEFKEKFGNVWEYTNEHEDFWLSKLVKEKEEAYIAGQKHAFGVDRERVKEEGRLEAFQETLEEIEERKSWYSGGGNQPIRDALDYLKTIINNKLKNK